jgi:hypothetical protein
VRELLRRRWSEAGRPSAGLVFPAVRDGRQARAGKDMARGPSEAEALRRLYRRAVGVDSLVDDRDRRGRSTRRWKQTRELTDREREVLEGTERVAPVTFHAGRNAFAQGCDDAGLTDEQTCELLDHENVKVTQGYQCRLARRAKHVPNVHPELDWRLAARRRCAQPGHIGARAARRENESPGFHRGSLVARGRYARCTTR